MDLMRIIGIVVAVAGASFLTLAVIWFLGFLKVCQTWAWIFEDWNHRF